MWICKWTRDIDLWFIFSTHYIQGPRNRMNYKDKFGGVTTDDVLACNWEPFQMYSNYYHCYYYLKVPQKKAGKLNLVNLFVLCITASKHVFTYKVHDAQRSLSKGKDSVAFRVTITWSAGKLKSSKSDSHLCSEQCDIFIGITKKVSQIGTWIYHEYTVHNVQ